MDQSALLVRVTVNDPKTGEHPCFGRSSLSSPARLTTMGMHAAP